MDPARRRALLEMRDDLFRLLEAMTQRVRADAAVFEVDADEYLSRVWADVDSFAARIGLTARPSHPRTHRRISHSSAPSCHPDRHCPIAAGATDVSPQLRRHRAPARPSPSRFRIASDVC